MIGKRFWILFVLVAVVFWGGVYVDKATAQFVIDDCTDDPALPGSYLVTANLSSSGDSLVVAASNVTIDLNGFMIERTGGGVTAGIRLQGSGTGITIRNGTIKGFSFGINLSGLVAGCLIENIIAMGNTSTGIRVPDGCIVRDNVATGSNFGIAVGSGNIVSGNTSSFNTLGAGNGISVGLNNVVTGNNASNNLNDGITGGGFSDSANNYIGNVANDNGGDGMEVGCPSNLTGNIAQRNGVGVNGGLNLNLIGVGCKRFGDNLF